MQNTVDSAVPNGSTTLTQCHEGIANMSNGGNERGGCRWKGKGETDESLMFGWEQRFQGLVKVLI